MRKKMLVLLATFVMVAAMGIPVMGDELAVKGRDILVQNQDAVIHLKVTIKQGVSYSGKDTEKNETSIETLGTVLRPDGLMLVSLSEIDPSSRIEAMMKMSSDEDVANFKYTSEITDAKYVLPNGKEIQAKVILRDKDLDLAFILPTAKVEKPFSFIDLTKAVDPLVMDPIYIVSRLGKSANRTPWITDGRVMTIIQKPQKYFFVSSTMGQGNPVFTSDGKVIGITLIRQTNSDGGSDGMQRMDITSMMPLVLPAADIVSAMEQITDKPAKK